MIEVGPRAHMAARRFAVFFGQNGTVTLNHGQVMSKAAARPLAAPVEQAETLRLQVKAELKAWMAPEPGDAEWLSSL